MKIVELCAIDQTMDIFLDRLNKGLVKEGFKVTLVCSKGPFTEKLKSKGFNVVNIKIDRKISLVSNIKSIYRLYKLFKDEKIDIVHVHTPIASVLGRIAARFAKVKLIIYTSHGFYFHENMNSLKYKIFLNIEKYIGRFFTDLIFTQSKEDRLTAIKNNFLKKERIIYIGNGVDTKDKFNTKNIDLKKIYNLYKDFKINEKDIVITFIGRLVKEKGILDLLKAMKLITKKNIKLLVIGDIDQGSRDKETKDILIDKYKKDERIIFTGFREDIKDFLFLTDIFILPSYREGMPRSIIEAMAMECAVIATDIRGCREEVIDGKTGFLVNVNSPKEIKEKIIFLSENTYLLKAMKNRARVRAETHFNEEKIVKKQIDIIKSFL
ncbi:MAG: glycosyltransferase family 4 protein [Firmicutes bacterium]|nr:glycosyltransferase family 4 protein [Bacillota bacterium]